jgi:RluA family pseudouridine synthase
LDTALKLTVLHDDGEVVAIDKPAGLVVIPARNEPAEQSVHHRLRAQLGCELWVVHRLDRDTSGVLLFARTASAHRTLSMAFEAHQVSKQYTAFLLSKTPLAASGSVRTPLHSARKGKMRPALVSEHGALASHTDWTTIAQRDGRLGFVAMVQASPKTGRQHQLRVHFRSMDAPLVVDPLYGGADRRALHALGAHSPPIDRTPLHARCCRFKSPANPEVDLEVSAPLPPSLVALERWICQLPEALD